MKDLVCKLFKFLSLEPVLNSMFSEFVDFKYMGCINPELNSDTGTLQEYCDANTALLHVDMKKRAPSQFNLRAPFLYQEMYINVEKARLIFYLILAPLIFPQFETHYGCYAPPFALPDKVKTKRKKQAAEEDCQSSLPDKKKSRTSCMRFIPPLVTQLKSLL